MTLAQVMRYPRIARERGAGHANDTDPRQSACSGMKKETYMAQSIRDVMTAHPVAMSATSSVVEAARTMRDSDIGDVIVVENGRICGMVTDRDITVRGVAEGRNISGLTLGDICSRQLNTLSPTASVVVAVLLLREMTQQRQSGIEGGQIVCIVCVSVL